MQSKLNKENFFVFIKNKKTKDYTYTTLFFFIFSFFVLFVIRPNIKSIFDANLEIENLKKENTIYEYEINNIIDIQGKLIEVRDDVYLIDQAITKRPEINEIINDIVETAKKNNININEFNLTDVNLKDISKNEELKNLDFNLIIKGTFNNYFSFLKDLYQQKRIKYIKKMTVVKGNTDKNSLIESTKSAEIVNDVAELSIQLLISGYYL